MTAAVTEQSTALARIDTTGLEPESALALRTAFETMFADAEVWAARAKEIRVTRSDQVREMKLARESRLALREIRVRAEHARKRLKEDSTRRGKAIDGIANVLKDLVEPIEAYLLEQEQFAERAEAARKQQLRLAREEALRALGTDPVAYANLGETSEEVWELTLRSAQEARGAREEAAKQAELVRVEAERIAAEKRETARQEAARVEAERAAREEAQRAEAERLKAELAEQERARAAERHAAAKERAAREEAAAAEKALLEEELRAKEADRLAAEKVAAAEYDRLRQEAEAQRRALAEATAREEQAAKERELAAAQAAEAALAPDRTKLVAFAGMLRGLKPLPLATERGKKAGAKIDEQLAKLAAWVEKCAGQL